MSSRQASGSSCSGSGGLLHYSRCGQSPDKRKRTLLSDKEAELT